MGCAQREPAHADLRNIPTGRKLITSDEAQRAQPEAFRQREWGGWSRAQHDAQRK